MRVLRLRLHCEEYYSYGELRQLEVVTVQLETAANVTAHDVPAAKTLLPPALRLIHR